MTNLPSPALQTNTRGQESQESVIDLTVDTEPCVSRLVEFLYSCDYDALEDDNHDASMDRSDTNNDNVDSEDETDDHSNIREARVLSKIDRIINSGIEANKKTWVSMISRQLSLHVDMYVLADKYDIVSLGHLAKEKFEGVAKKSGPFSADTKFLVS